MASTVNNIDQHRYLQVDGQKAIITNVPRIISMMFGGPLIEVTNRFLTPNEVHLGEFFGHCSFQQVNCLF